MLARKHLSCFKLTVTLGVFAFINNNKKNRAFEKVSRFLLFPYLHFTYKPSQQEEKEKFHMLKYKWSFKI